MNIDRIKYLIASAVFIAGCSPDPNNEPAADSGTPDAGVTSDVGTTPDSSGTDGGADDATSGGDSGDTSAGSDCLQVAAVPDTFDIVLLDDVSVDYDVSLDTNIDGKSRELVLLFERYGNTDYVGTFDLSMTPDDNFGTCAHCAYIRGDSPERGYYVDRGTLVSNSDPFSRRADFEVQNLRLIEVGIDPMTRASVPIPDGECIEVADFEASGVFPPSGWLCDDEEFNDGQTCHCECGAYDFDCGGEISCLPGDSSCTPRPELPVENCAEDQVCAFEPVSMGTACTETCDWLGRTGCTTGTCVFDFGVGQGDLCIPDGPRIDADVGLGGDCSGGGLQKVCAVDAGFPTGFCGPDNLCRPVCEDDGECTEDGETCRKFTGDGALGYCGPEPTDPDG